MSVPAAARALLHQKPDDVAGVEKRFALCVENYSSADRRVWLAGSSYFREDIHTRFLRFVQGN